MTIFCIYQAFLDQLKFLSQFDLATVIFSSVVFCDQNCTRVSTKDSSFYHSQKSLSKSQGLQ